MGSPVTIDVDRAFSVHSISPFHQRALTTSPAAAADDGPVMTRQNLLLLWSPRVLGIAVSFFLGLFALDAFEPGKPVAQAWIDFAIHLAPAAGVLAIVGLSWRRPWIGGTAFILLAAAYALSVGFRLDWTIAISGPLLAVGLLFLWSWRKRQPLQAP